MRTKDVVLLISSFGFIIFLTILSWTYPFQAALFPRLLLVAGFVVCTLELIMELKHKGQSPGQGRHSSEEDLSGGSIKEGRLRIAIFIACGLSYLFLLQPLGYILTQFLVIGVLFTLLGMNWKTTLALAVGTAFGGYFVFAVALQLPLPTGIVERLIF
jgi:hypothetical protein